MVLKEVCGRLPARPTFVVGTLVCGLESMLSSKFKCHVSRLRANHGGGLIWQMSVNVSACIPEVVAIQLAAIHAHACLLCICPLLILHVCKAPRQVHHAINGQLHTLHNAKGAENLLDVVLVHIPRQPCHMQAAGLWTAGPCLLYPRGP